MHPRTDGPADRLLDENLARECVAPHGHCGNHPEKRDDDRRGDCGQVIAPRQAARPSRLQEQEEEDDDGSHRTLDERGYGDENRSDQEGPEIVVTQKAIDEPDPGGESEGEAHIHSRRLRRAPDQKRTAGDNCRPPSGVVAEHLTRHTHHQPEEKKESEQRRDHEGPERVEAEKVRQAVDEPEVNGRLVAERLSIEDRHEKNVRAPHLADHFTVLGLVADIQLPLDRREQRRKNDKADDQL